MSKNQPSASTSQENVQAIDTGEESFCVDSVLSTVNAETETGQEIETEAEQAEKQENQKQENAEDEENKAKDEPGDESEDESEDGPEDEPSDKEKQKLPKGVEKRLAKMRKKQGDAERRAEAAEMELEALKRKQELAKSTEIGEKPKVDDFETEEEYLEALADYKINKKYAELEAKRTEQLEAKAAEERKIIEKRKQEKLQESFGKAAKKYKDFNETVKDIFISNAMAEVLAIIPNAGDVAYYLGKNPDITEDIASMPTVETVLAIQEISNKVKPKKTSKAPAPIKPIRTHGGNIKTPEHMTMKEYIEFRRKQGA